MTNGEVHILLSRIDAMETGMSRRFDEVDERFVGIDSRLDKGEERFKLIDKAAAQRAGMVKVATWIGSAVIMAGGAAGSYFLSYVPDLLKWLVSRP